MALACCCALPIKLLGHHHSALLNMLPAFPMVLAVMVYSLLSGHFAMVGLRYWCHAVLLPSCRFAAVHVAYRCTCCLPLFCRFATVVQPCHQYRLSVLSFVSFSLCLPLFDYFATFKLLSSYFVGIILLLPVSCGLNTVMPVFHACCSPTVILLC